MRRIRPLEREDVPRVCRLYERVARSGSPDPPPQLAGYFERTVLDHPWYDPEIPSLVYEGADGEIVGFLGSHVRRLRVDGRPIRMAASGQLVADPTTRQRGVGALLMRHFLAGPQELAITDGATETVRQMWTGLGGQALVHASIGWTKVLRPAAMSAAMMSQSARSVVPTLARSLRFVAPPLDAAAQLVARRADIRLTPPDATAEPLTVDALLDQIRAAARFLRLYPDYDAEFVRWLFQELSAIDGAPVRHLVRDRRGRVAGWYIYHLPPAGVASALQVAAPGGDPDLVLDHLFWDAACRGAAAVQGRLEPALFGPLGGRRSLLRRSSGALAHTDDQHLLGVLGSPKALLTRLDGEWWMGHHLLWRRRGR